MKFGDLAHQVSKKLKRKIYQGEGFRPPSRLIRVKNMLLKSWHHIFLHFIFWTSSWNICSMLQTMHTKSNTAEITFIPGNQQERSNNLKPHSRIKYFQNIIRESLAPCLYNFVVSSPYSFTSCAPVMIDFKVLHKSRMLKSDILSSHALHGLLCIIVNLFHKLPW